jgi:hypothetical protein
MNETATPKPKPPARPATAIRADIERERAALDGAFETLRRDLDEGLDAGRRRLADAGRKARTVAPVAVGLVVAGGVARLLLRRRRTRG